MTSDREKAVLRALGEAWGLFVEICRDEPSHQDDLREFVEGIHRCQCVLSHRVAKRADPETWGEKESC